MKLKWEILLKEKMEKKSGNCFYVNVLEHYASFGNEKLSLGTFYGGGGMKSAFHSLGLYTSVYMYIIHYILYSVHMNDYKFYNIHVACKHYATCGNEKLSLGTF